MSFIEIEQEAHRLPTAERAALVASLIGTFPTEQPAITDEDAERRDAELESGAVIAVPHEEFVRAAQAARNR